MDIAALRTRITFQKCEEHSDEIGNHWNEWTDCFSCWATAGSSSGSESFNAGTDTTEESIDFTCRYSKALAGVSSTGYRIVAEGKTYDIDYVNPMSFKRNSLKFRCKLEKPQ